jgi:hypothetical protein
MAPKQRNIRKRRALDDDDDQSGDEQKPSITTEDIRLLQKQRQRRQGVDAAALAVDISTSAALASLAGPADQDPKTTAEDGLQHAFKKEINQVATQDVHMQKYVEEQLALRLGKRPNDQDDDDNAKGKKANSGGGLASLEDELLANIKPRQQDQELASWVTGITEVPLTIEQKLVNIEKTEAAKNKLLATGLSKSAGIGGSNSKDRGEKGDMWRGNFPVKFGKHSSKEVERITAAQQAKQSRKK